MRKILLALFLCLASVQAHAACNPANAPANSIGCLPNNTSAQLTDILYGWRPSLFPNADMTDTVQGILNTPSSTQYLPFTGGTLVGPLTANGFTNNGPEILNGGVSIFNGGTLSGTFNGSPIFSGIINITGGLQANGNNLTLPNAAAVLNYVIGTLNNGDCLEASGTNGGIGDAGAACALPAVDGTGTTLLPAVVHSSLTSVGIITSGVWQGTALGGAQMLPLPTGDVYQGNGSNQAAAVALTNALDALGAVQGDIAYRNATGWTVLPPGTSGFFLETLGPSANPVWASVGGGSSGCTIAGGSQFQILVNNGASGCSTSPNASVNVGALTLGLSGTLGSITMGNATSGTATLEPTTGALGTVTLLLPDISDTLVTLTATQTLTNKSIAGSEVNSGTIAGTFLAVVNLAASGNGGVTGLLPNANLANAAITINGITCTLGSSCTTPADASTLINTTLAANVVSSSLTGLGTITSGVWNGTPLTGAFMLALPSGDVYQGNGSNQAAPVTISAALDAAFGATQGAVLYRGASSWAELGPGTSGFFLETLGASANPVWATVAGGGSGCTISGGSQFQILVNNGSSGCSSSANGSLNVGALTLGGSGTAGSVTMGNATSGTMTLQPITGALGTVTVSIPDITDTLVTLTATQTLTNKTYSGGTLGGTFTGNATLSGALTFSGGGTLGGVWAGNPGFSGNPTFSGTPNFTGLPTTTTPGTGDNSNSIATTQFVANLEGGNTTISAAGSGTLTLTTAQAGVNNIILNGALTGNKTVIFPTTGDWSISNQTTGAFTLTVQTLGGTGLLIAQGGTQLFYSNGTNIVSSLTDLTNAGMVPAGSGFWWDSSTTVVNTTEAFPPWLWATGFITGAFTYTGGTAASVTVGLYINGVAIPGCTGIVVSSPSTPTPTACTKTAITRNQILTEVLTSATNSPTSAYVGFTGTHSME